MTKRRILAIIIALVLCISLCACEQRSNVCAAENEGNIFVVVADGFLTKFVKQTVMYDPDTLVMYTYVYRGDGCTISVLYNADGTLKLYSPKAETTK